MGRSRRFHRLFACLALRLFKPELLGLNLLLDELKRQFCTLAGSGIPE
jgi:hypothetical protein